MHFRQKLIFTALGSALTLAGYLLATIVSDVTAQDNKTESLGDIVCDSITVRDGGPIKILDKDDIMRMFITDTDIYLYDKSSTLRIQIEVIGDVPVLIFNDKSSTVRLIMGFDEATNAPFLTLRDKSATPRILMAVDDDNPSLKFRDKSSTGRIRMGVYDAINGPYLEFYDKSGKLECRLKQHSHICLSAGTWV
jgi:hypothetical protein